MKISLTIEEAKQVIARVYPPAPTLEIDIVGVNNNSTPSSEENLDDTTRDMIQYLTWLNLYSQENSERFKNNVVTFVVFFRSIFKASLWEAKNAVTRASYTIGELKKGVALNQIKF